MSTALPAAMHTTTTTPRLDSLLLRVKHRAAFDLLLPAMALVGIAMAVAVITGA
jgi:hypothetical protein